MIFLIQFYAVSTTFLRLRFSCIHRGLGPSGSRLSKVFCTSYSLAMSSSSSKGFPRRSLIWYIIPLGCSGSFLGSSLSLTCLEYLNRELSRRHLNYWLQTQLPLHHDNPVQHPHYCWWVTSMAVDLILTLTHEHDLKLIHLGNYSLANQKGTIDRVPWSQTCSWL